MLRFGDSIRFGHGKMTGTTRSRVRSAACFRAMIGTASARPTVSFSEWWASHESEARRGFTQTTLLPWGLLASHSSARLPYSTDKTITRTSLLWGLGGSVALDSA